MAMEPTYKNTPHRNVQYISLSWFLVFSGVNSALVFGTSDYGDYAATSLAILYTSFALSALFIVPYILNNNLLSAKYCAFFGSLVDILFISQYIVFINEYYLYLASMIQGIGVSMYWIGTQQYIMQCAKYYEQQHDNVPDKSSIGMFQGIYFAFYEFSTFSSNILSAILFTLKLSNSIVYTIFTVICAFGCMMTLFADNIQPKKAESNTRVSSISTITMWKEPELQCLMLMSVYFGIFQQFEYGIFPTLIADKSMKFFVMACYGVSGTLFCKLFTKIWNQINAYWIISTGIFLNMLVYLFILNTDVFHPVYLFIIALCNGFIEASFFVTLFTLYPIICGDKPESFANQQFFQQIGLAIGYLMYCVLGFYTKIIFAFVTMAFAVFVFYKSKVIRKHMNCNQLQQNKECNLINAINEEKKASYNSMSIVIISSKLMQHYHYMVHHDAESDGYESTYSEIEDSS